ncbi:MAG: N(4)-(beta-N-acetylglucosaminyl)-L-asparaginase [Bacteroidetes bacterium]|nr:N(4)-(beta-N-acetylglucosaminyl)-L-asparaginase [Bacteroidota bacterium]
MKRRSFFKVGVLGGAAAVLTPKDLFAAQTTLIKDSEIKNASKPIVLSTWSHGLEANKGAWSVLENKGSSLDAVMKGAMVTESDRSNRSVGISGMPDRTGHVTLDACIMDSEGRSGAVGFVEGFEHPIQIAREVMEQTPHAMLVGKGAEIFAKQLGFKKLKSPISEVKKEYKEWIKKNPELVVKPIINHENHDTIGILAMDSEGKISGSCTTSGWAYKMPGRLGDSPIIGAGLFIDNEVGGAVATGLGEAIIRIAGSHTVVECMRNGMSPEEACKEAVNRIIRKNKDLTGLQCGFIALDKDGNYGAYSVYNGFNIAVKSIDKEELIDSAYDRKW